MHVFSQFCCFSMFLVFPEHVCSEPIKRVLFFHYVTRSSPGLLGKCSSATAGCHFFVIAEGQNILVEDLDHCVLEAAGPGGSC